MDKCLPSLIQQMLQPAFYDHAVDAPIQLIQTHISYVLLTGDYAYKIKKPAAFGFLDFTTLAQRKYYCTEELRLNRRLSPKLYLDVVSISQVDQQYYLGKVPAIEYAVKMRQFPQADLFSQRFKNNALQMSDLIALAKQVASFHCEMATTPQIQAYGELEVVRSVHENNLHISEAFFGVTQTQQQYEDTRAFCLHCFQSHQGWFNARIEHVKECHGDLHLNNVCCYRGQVQVFDCIEFNQEFRNIDTLYDAAFMVMDLEYHQRSDLAYGFLNTYLEETGDYLGVRLLPFYLSMRAYIRGNVNSLAMKDPAIAPNQQQDLKQNAIAYYQLAWTYTQRSQGCLYLMSGLSGSGKSTVARYLSQTKPAIHIRSDALRKHLAGIPLTQDGTDSKIYSAEMTRKTYQELLAVGIPLAQSGWAVILDAKYDRKMYRKQAIAACERHQLDLKILHCVADLPTLRQRLAQRYNDISDANADLLKHQQLQWESFSVTEYPYVYPIQTESNFKAQVQRLEEQQLEKWKGSSTIL